MTQRTRILLACFTVALLTLSALPEAAWACPNCKEAYMDTGGGASPIASGFNASIVFMMIMPFVVMGLFALRIWIAMRRKRAEGPVA